LEGEVRIEGLEKFGRLLNDLLKLEFELFCELFEKLVPVPGLEL
jgi:hypothetical protein